MIENILITGGIGSLVFTLFLLLMAATGIASAMRDEEGNFRKNFHWKTVFGGVAFLFFLFSILYLGNLNYKNSLSTEPTFFQLWINSFGIFFVIHLYDLIVLDYLIIVKWHPSFLKLPNTEYYTTIKPHVDGFYRGIPFGVVTSVVVSLISILTL